MTKLDTRSEDAAIYRAWYKTARWQKMRAWYLRANPLCAFCAELGIAIPADIVDHIKPHRGDYTLFWSNDNLQGLCKRHHDSDKQKIEKSAHKPQTGLDGWPIENS